MAAEYTVTLKGGSGYDKPWLVIKANSEAEMLNALDQVIVSNMVRKIRLADISLKSEWSHE